MIGSTVSHHRVTEKLGHYGVGVTCKDRGTHLGRFFAIKALPPEQVAELALRAHFVQEAEAACARNHPNIATHDHSSDAVLDFIALGGPPTSSSCATACG